MSFLDAAVRILRETGRPMTARVIVDEAIARDLIRTNGRTPDATLLAQLYLRVRDDPDGPIEKLANPGATRARRGTVRWAWRVTPRERR